MAKSACIPKPDRVEFVPAQVAPDIERDTGGERADHQLGRGGRLVEAAVRDGLVGQQGVATSRDPVGITAGPGHVDAADPAQLAIAL